MAKANKLIAILTAAAVGLTTILSFNFSALADTPVEDLIIADFSTADANASSSEDEAYRCNFQAHCGDFSSDITLHDGEQSLKIDDTNKGGNSGRLWTSADLFTVGDLLDHKYLNMWVYSDNANGQKMNAHMMDATVGKNGTLYTASGGSQSDNFLTIDWTGWKLVSFPYNTSTDSSDKPHYMTLTDFGDSATRDDKAYLWIQFSGYTAGSWLSDTVVCIDSIWLSENDPRAITPSGNILSSDIKNGMRDISTATSELVITADEELYLGANYYDDKITLTCDNAPLTVGTDYKISAELNKLYIKFINPLVKDSTYKVVLSKDALMADGQVTGLETDYSVEFTVNEVEFDIADFDDYDFGGLTVPPASGTVSVSLPLTNKSSAPVTAQLFVGVYNKNTNWMEKLGVGTSVTISAGGTDTFEAEVSVDGIIGYSPSTHYIRAFLWTNENEMYSFGPYGEIR